METNSNLEPTHRRLRFSFEAFDQMLAEALVDVPELADGGDTGTKDDLPPAA